MMTETTTETVRLTADVVVIGDDGAGVPYVLLIRRRRNPYRDCWALPGGHVTPGEEVEAAARRELAEETGLVADRLTLVGVYSAPGRDPRGRYVTWAYLATVSGMPECVAGDDAADARWWPLSWARDHPGWVAFDHHQIIGDSLASLTVLPIVEGRHV